MSLLLPDSKPPVLDRVPLSRPAVASPTRRALSNRRLLMAFIVAALSDGVFKWAGELIPPLEWALDVITATCLFIILGWRWPLLPALLMEAIPGVSVFPFWVLVVGALAVQERAMARPPAEEPRQLPPS